MDIAEEMKEVYAVYCREIMMMQSHSWKSCQVQEVEDSGLTQQKYQDANAGMSLVDKKGIQARSGCLIQKRNDKCLDYDRWSNKIDKIKDRDKLKADAIEDDNEIKDQLIRFPKKDPKDVGQLTAPCKQLRGKENPILSSLTSKHKMWGSYRYPRGILCHVLRHSDSSGNPEWWLIQYNGATG
ncbi:hypothetical protein OS493_038233, partial [Desmophyllum pertusum]